MNTPRIVFACNHYIKETFEETLSKRMKYSGIAPDNMTPAWEEKYLARDVLISPGTVAGKGSIVITDIKCKSSANITEEEERAVEFSFIQVNPVSYIQGYDYDLVSEFKTEGQYIYIDWRKSGRHPDANTGAMSVHYIVDIKYDRHFSNQYEPKQCPRCCGDGWYVGLFEQNMSNATLVKEENRLIQSFFKYIYTRKTATGYGSSILELPGKYSAVDEKTMYSMIDSEIEAFSNYYKNQTSTLMLNGDNISDEEILHSYHIISMELIEDTYSVDVKIRFYTMAGSKLNVDIILPEEE